MLPLLHLPDDVWSVVFWGVLFAQTPEASQQPAASGITVKRLYFLSAFENQSRWERPVLLDDHQIIMFLSMSWNSPLVVFFSFSAVYNRRQAVDLSKWITVFLSPVWKNSHRTVISNKRKWKKKKVKVRNVVWERDWNNVEIRVCPPHKQS